MTRKLKIVGFEDLNENAEAAEVQFGGQPLWIDAPQWPYSDAWNRPMMFICQIPLNRVDEVFGKKVAYVFATHATFNERDEFFDPDVIFPDGGENAVIIQPNGLSTAKTRPDATGPALYTSDGNSITLAPTLEAAQDPSFVGQTAYMSLSKQEQDRYFSAVSGNKIGGVPAFSQGDDWPEPGHWRLLLQLETSARRLPFFVNFGASPVLFAFVSVDGLAGKLLIQDS